MAETNPMAPSKGGAAEKQPSRRRKTNRREQQRSIETRQAILEAALNEFAERGFDGASTRRIGERAGLEYTLITYHYRTKEALWKAVAQYAFEQIETLWDTAVPIDSEMCPADRVRVEFRTFLSFTVEHTAFHHFMLRENQGSSSRMRWLIDKILSKTRERVLPQIRAAQAEGKLIGGDPDYVYYMLIGMTSALSSLNREMSETIGFSIKDEQAVDRYWKLIERAVFL